MSKNIYQKFQSVKQELAKSELKKTGRNPFLKFDYFELSDFLPKVIELFTKEGLCSYVSFSKEEAKLRIVDTESEGIIDITSPMVEPQAKQGVTIMQDLGAIQTYSRRYLYMAALDLVEDDSLDKSIGNPETKKSVSKPSKSTNNDTFTDEEIADTFKGQVIYECEDCETEITDKVASFSKSKFGKALCFSCQKKHK